MRVFIIIIKKLFIISSSNPNLIDPLIWYYVLTTVAQTLAAILALGGTFIIFKLNIMKERMGTLREKIIEILIVFKENKYESYFGITDDKISRQLKDNLSKIDSIRDEKKNLLIDIYKNYKKDGSYSGTQDFSIVKSFLEWISERFKADTDRKYHILKLLKVSVIILSSVIIISILFLPFQIHLMAFDILVIFVVLISTFLGLLTQGIIIWDVVND